MVIALYERYFRQHPPPPLRARQSAESATCRLGGQSAVHRMGPGIGI